MNPRIKGSLLILLFLFVFISSGIFEGSDIGANRLVGLLRKGGGGAKSRKLMGFNAVLDYDYAGPNPKHDPRGRKGGGRNP
ncbi:hypothetical protein BUALT_Bualt06G0089400 [Buddleja alternifolia]|uniref:Glycine-rich protein n=1 Tax=Buddleja alternifolia TaxID=168488 RepID=A0AAV6XPY9_9LAMI|nr:hypothetical protein BUALT_Bualt06G0089400 [Buddleja alternifolia]